MVATPEPANLIAMIGGMRAGLAGCAGFIAGLVTGKLALDVAFGIGFGVLPTSRPVILNLMKHTGAAYTGRPALGSWNPPESDDRPNRDFRFQHGVVAHPLNPKAWIMVLLAWSQFAPALGEFWLQMVVVPLSFAACQILFHSLWCWIGEVMGRVLPQSVRLTRALAMLAPAVVIWALLQ